MNEDATLTLQSSEIQAHRPTPEYRTHGCIVCDNPGTLLGINLSDVAAPPIKPFSLARLEQVYRDILNAPHDPGPLIPAPRCGQLTPAGVPFHFQPCMCNAYASNPKR